MSHICSIFHEANIFQIAAVLFLKKSIEIRGENSIEQRLEAVKSQTEQWDFINSEFKQNSRGRRRKVHVK